MRKILLLFLLPFFIIAQSEISAKAPEWLTDYRIALKKAQNEEKNLFIYFTGSDWCPPCKMLKKDLFDTKEFEMLSKKYVLLYIDLPRGRNKISSDQLLHNQKLLGKLNKKGVFPFIAILNEKEKVLDEISGYSMDGNTKRHLKLFERHKR